MDAKRLTARAPALKGLIVDSVVRCRMATCYGNGDNRRKMLIVL